MNSNEIFALIERIAATPSKIEKQALVKAHIDTGEVHRVLVAALDPLTTYGLQQVPARTNSVATGHAFSPKSWKILGGLAVRSLTGDAARTQVQLAMNELSADSAELFKRIIIKDLKAGFGASTVNKAAPGTISEFPYMRCCLPKDAKLDKFSWESGVFSQEKADGMFANLDREMGGLVRITSRQGSEFPLGEFTGVVQEALTWLPGGTQTHGELEVMKDGKVLPREVGNGMLNAVQQGGKFDEGCRPVYRVWDQIPLEAVVPKGRYEVEYATRFGGLEGQLLAGLDIQVIPTRVIHSLAEGYAHYRELLARGKEGVVIKTGTAVWRDGDSKEQVKLKLEADCDLQIVGIVPGKDNGKNAGRPGSLTCITFGGELQVDVTVKNEKMREAVEKAPDDWIGRIIVVKANAIMAPSESNVLHSLFLPRMVEAAYRLDKEKPDTLQRVRDQFDAAAQAA